MATPQPSTAIETPTGANRLCWVLNNDRVYSYKASFQGMKIEIPANRAKIAKHVREGGNLMESLAAERFIGDFKEPQEWTQDRSGKMNPVFRTKELYKEELTLDETEKIVGKQDPKKIKDEIAKEEKKARRAHANQVAKVANKVQATEED